MVHGTGKRQFRQPYRTVFAWSFFIFRSKPNIYIQLGNFQWYFIAQNFFKPFEGSFDKRDEKVSQ